MNYKYEIPKLYCLFKNGKAAKFSDDSDNLFETWSKLRDDGNEYEVRVVAKNLTQNVSGTIGKPKGLNPDGTKRRDLGEGNTRDLLKFFSKRTTCSCLKNMYSEARKNMPKMGKCSYCDGVKERRLLSVCSKCRINQYCSRECQVLPPAFKARRR